MRQVQCCQATSLAALSEQMCYAPEVLGQMKQHRHTQDTLHHHRDSSMILITVKDMHQPNTASEAMKAAVLGGTS